jgi:hypothetical protein
MTVTVPYYRTSDLTRWGTGTGADLSAAQFDMDMWTLQTAINGLTLATPVGISTFTVTGGTFTVTLTDATVQGPFDLPLLHWNARGAWAASTAYAVADTFYVNGAAYEVLIAHTSATTFSAGATDGLGHNLYGEILVSPSNMLPTGGSTGQVLAKNSATDFDTVFITPHYVIPGGTTGQVLSKTSSTDYALAWINPPGGIPTGGATGEFVGYGGTSGTGAWATVIQLPAGGTTGQTLVKNSGTDGDASWTTPASPALALVSLSPTTGSATFNPDVSDVVMFTPTGTLTINASLGTNPKRVTFIITTSGTTSYTLTFGTYFTNTSGTLSTGTVSGKVFTVEFITDGTNFFETSRVGPI